MVFIIIAASAVFAGFIQGVTGFGTGLVMMLILPLYYPLPQSAGSSVAIAVALCISMSIRYRKDLSIKKAVIPSIWYMIVCSITINLSKDVSPIILKRSLGVFLLVLSVYYLCFNKKPASDRGLPLPASIVCITVSGICDGMFGIGGPLMVLYFLSNTKTTREYLGTLQLFFVINGIYGSVFRISQGILGWNNLPCIIAGWTGILIGVVIANRLVDRINADLLRKLVYIMIGISGIVYLIH